jgi:beta-phosphoglucomutase family hydrolase
MTEKQIAFIFDMDGVLVDNLEYHVIAWLEFCAKKNIPLTREEFFQNLNGKNAQDTMNYFFKREVEPELAHTLNEEKEVIYKEIYRPHVKPAEGLVTLLESLKAKGVKLAVGTSAPQGNIDFTLDNAGIRHYFDEIVDSSMVTNGKPAPDIYLKAAEKLGVAIDNCIVAEDAMQGIQAGLSAGMKVIGITTSHTAEELAHTHLQAPNFTGITYDTLVELLAK